MLFNSFSFPVFLAASWLVYRLLHTRRLPRLVWLLLISAFFYGCWKPWYLILIAVSTLHSYHAGWRIDRSDDPAIRKRWLILGIAGDLTLLGIFKYGNFLLESAEQLSGLGLPRIPVELPVGISFYTFQTLSYTIDLYMGRIRRSRSLLSFSVFVIFFPQLVAGPIVRAKDFLPQLEEGGRPRLDRAALGEGIFLILAGLTKKMVLADLLSSRVVAPFFHAPGGHNTVEALVALWAANFQVYCDFSGYSDVAIGAALLFGFQLPLNFDRPFWSRTPMEHWRRWHISLSTWLKDYLYIPLGGSRGSGLRTDFNLVVTFLLGGLWHGAGWTFVIWGLYNGLLLVGWRRWGPRDVTKPLLVPVAVFATFNAICFGLVFLHAASFGEASAAFGSLFNPSGAFTPGLLEPVGVGALVAAAALHFTPQSWKRTLRSGFAAAPGYALGLTIVIVGGLLSLFAGLARPFFYFQF